MRLTNSGGCFFNNYECFVDIERRDIYRSSVYMSTLIIMQIDRDFYIKC